MEGTWGVIEQHVKCTRRVIEHDVEFTRRVIEYDVECRIINNNNGYS